MSGSSPSDSGNCSNPPRPEGSLPIDDNSHSQAENLHAASSNEEGQSIVPGRIPASPNQHEVGEVPETNPQNDELAALIAEESQLQDRSRHHQNQSRQFQEQAQRVRRTIDAITLNRQQPGQSNQANNASINSNNNNNNNNNNNAANADSNDSVANESDAPRSEQSAHNVTEGSQSQESDDHQMNEGEASGNIGNEGNDGGN